MDMPDVGEKVGPLPLWGWIAGGGVILAAVFLLGNRGGGGGGGTAAVPVIGSVGAGGVTSGTLDTAVAAARAQEQAAGRTLLEQMAAEGRAALAAAVTEAQAASAAALAGQAAQQQRQLDEMRAADQAEDDAFSRLIEQLRATAAEQAAKIAELVKQLSPQPQQPTPQQPQTPQSPDPFADQPAWWTAGLKPGQSRNILTLAVQNFASVWRPWESWMKGGGSSRGGTLTEAGKTIYRLLPKGLDTGYGFKLPVAYDGNADKSRFSYNGKNTESAWERVWRWTNEYMRQHPNADPGDVFDLMVRRLASDAAGLGYDLNNIGFSLQGLKSPTRYLGRPDLLRADQELIAQGMDLSLP